MARLTKAIKEKIVANALVKAGVVERHARNEKSRAELADACRIEALGGKAKVKEMVELKDQLDAMREKFLKVKGSANTKGSTVYFQKQHGITVAFGGMQTVLNYSGRVEDESNIHTDKSVHLAPAPYFYSKAILLAHDHPLTKFWEMVESEQKIINDIKTNIEANTWAMLNSATTDTKLLEAWPEAIELLPKDVSKTNLPSVNVDSLNDMIGIPTEKDHA